jgi:hypothetical protein
MRNWQVLVLPELRHFSPAERRAAIRQARDTDHDLLELAGLAVALVLATWATRYGVDAGAVPGTRLMAALVNFAIAVPVLLAAALPLHIRRLRRGLRAQLARRPHPP